MTRDVIVVGGGVIGCSIAWRLAQAGLTVSVFERGRIGGEASRAAAGMLSPQTEAQAKGPFFDLCLQSRAMHRGFADELKDCTGIDVEYKDEGTLFVELPGEPEQTTSWAEWQLEAGLPLEHVEASDIPALEPAVTKSAAKAIFLPLEHQIENRRLMDALEVALRSSGVEVIEGADVTEILTERGCATGVISAGQRFDAGAVVLAAGAWSSRLLEPLGLHIKVIPARGQMIAIKGDKCPVTRIIHSSSIYVVPRRDGRILIGATVEYAGFHKVVTVDAVKHLLSAATELVPSLEEFEIVEAWSGLRPDTIDHLPIIGPCGPDNLTLATGHFRNGVLLAPLTAQLVATSLTKGPVPDQLKRFGVGRFDSRSVVQSR